MAGFLKKIVGKLSGYQEDEYEDEYMDPSLSSDYMDPQQEYAGYQDAYAPQAAYQPEPKQYSAPIQNTSAPKVVPLKSAALGEQQLVILQPNNIESAQRVVDHLRAGHTVICNIENVDAKIAQRVIDFICGSTYAIDGNVKSIDVRAHTFVAVPRSVSLVTKDEVPQETNDYVEPFRMVH
jgi:cell division inhibitor SepF